MTGMVSMGGRDSYAHGFINTLLAASARSESELTPEEKTKRDNERRKLAKEQIRQAKIIKNICPICDGRLVRGKKNKKNDYKRVWTCSQCGSSHNV